MAVPNYGITELVLVSNLAIKLYRRCKESPNEFASLKTEVANLRNLVDDIRITVKERQENLSETHRQQLLELGQGCLDCLGNLEHLITKYGSLGNKAKLSLQQRLKWDKRDVDELRLRLISNISLLDAFNSSLTRSSTARIEEMLRGFIEDFKSGRHEGSVLSVDTIRSIKNGNEDDIWIHLKKDFEDAGISHDQLLENRALIIDRVKSVIESGCLDQKSTVALSFHTATDGGSNRYSGSTAFNRMSPYGTFQFPGSEFYVCKYLVVSTTELYMDSPEEYSNIRNQLCNAQRIIKSLGHGRPNPRCLSYHENLSRKPMMLPILDNLNKTLQSLQSFQAILRTAVPGDHVDFQWSKDKDKTQEISKLGTDLDQFSSNLKCLFEGTDPMLLCDLEDVIKIIIKEVKEKERSRSILTSWDELEAALVDLQNITKSNLQDHETAILSFLQAETEEWFSLEERRFKHVRNGSIGDASTAISEFTVPEGSGFDVRSIPGQTHTSATAESDSYQSNEIPEPRNSRPTRLSVLFVDYNNKLRSPIAQAYFEYLRSLHPALAGHFSRISSSGITASKPGVPLFAGIDFMLRDYGIASNFKHTSRRLERRDVEKFEYVLTMSAAQRENILSGWDPRPEGAAVDPPNFDGSTPEKFYREDLEDRVVVLGSFGGYGDREVSIPESINGDYWFHLGTKRIYPGYDKCFQEIKTYIADFVFATTGFDVHSRGVGVNQDQDSREVSPDASDNEDFGNGWSTPKLSNDDVKFGFEALRRDISRYTESSSVHDADGFPDIESPIQVTIKADQPAETDEEELHKHHEQYDRLMKLLLTDVGDKSSLRKMVMDWENDNSRNILAVTTGACHWVLEKLSTDSNDSCSRCSEQSMKCGFVRDPQHEVITIEEAKVIAQYLSIAIKESLQDKGRLAEQSAALESIRDSNNPRPLAPPSIRDDVSVSVRDDKPGLEYAVTKIRQRQAENKLAQAAKERAKPLQPKNEDPMVTQKLIRRKTDDLNFLPSRIKPLHAEAIDKTSPPQFVPPIATIKSKFSTPGRASPARRLATSNAPVERPKTPPAAVKPVSVLFLGASQLHGVIMAEVYLFSQVEKNLVLARQINDVVSSGEQKTSADEKLNPKKLERVFKKHDIFKFWPQKPERLLMPEDVVDFDYILLVANASLDAPYDLWVDDNPDEAHDMQTAAAAAGLDWKANFASKVRYLRDWDAEERRNVQLWDPVQKEAGNKSKFGVPSSEFEKHFARIKYAVDHFLLEELGYDVEERRFVDPKKVLP